MRTIVVSPPAPVVAWADADQHLKLGGDASQRAEVEAMIATATAHLDGPDGWLGRALGEQTLEARFDLLGADHCVRLPLPPTIELISVKYLDFQGGEQDVSLDEFELLGNDLVPAGGSFPWEGGSLRREAGRVRYRAGYSELPAPIRTAILMMVGDLYRFRETAMTGTGMAVPMSVPVKALLGPFQVFG